MLQFLNFNNTVTEKSKETWRFAEAWYWSRDFKMTEIELKVNMKYSDSDEKYREELDVLCQRKLFKI